MRTYSWHTKAIMTEHLPFLKDNNEINKSVCIFACCVKSFVKKQRNNHCTSSSKPCRHVFVLCAVASKESLAQRRLNQRNDRAGVFSTLCNLECRQSCTPEVEHGTLKSAPGKTRFLLETIIFPGSMLNLKGL